MIKTVVSVRGNNTVTDAYTRADPGVFVDNGTPDFTSGTDSCRRQFFCPVLIQFSIGLIKVSTHTDYAVKLTPAFND